MFRPPTDSTGNLIRVGDRVRFRGREYTIREFVPAGHLYSILFVESQQGHTDEVADEVSVDLVRRE